MCLPFSDLATRSLAKGDHAGFEFEVVRSPVLSGFCGYVRVTDGHPWFELHYDDFDVDVNGGLTFAGYGSACPTHGPAAEWWVGFDTLHGLKAYSRTMRVVAGETLPDETIDSLMESDLSLEETIDECKRLAEYAADVALNPLRDRLALAP